MKSLKTYNNISIRFLRISLFALATMAICFNISCGKKDDKSKDAAKKTRSPAPVIAAVELDPPDPKSSDFIRVHTKLENQRMSHVTYSYLWNINGKPLEENNGNLLDKKYYKKGDEIYCRVTAARGSYKSKPVECKKVKVLNSPPVFDLTPVNAFQVPGLFKYTIKASDPDGDALTYLLVSPQDMGIDINPETGLITWEIQEVPQYNPEEEDSSGSPEEEGAGAPKSKTKTKDAAPKLTSVIKLIFEVRDSEGAVVRASIDLNLNKGQEIPE